MSDSPAYRFVNSLQIIRPNDIPEDIFISGTKFKPKDDDIMVVTYPKCGTTWTQSILWMLTNNLEPCTNANEIILKRFIELAGKEEIEKIQDVPRVLKTHFPSQLCQWNPKTKYIFVVRNPYDCVVSFYHHTRAFNHYNFTNGKFSDYFEHFMNGHVDWSDYFDHLASWYKLIDRPNVLFLVFEDMKSDLPAAIRKIGEFLGGKYAEMVESESVVEKIVAGVDIKNMHSMSVTKVEGSFFRKGVVGDWKNYLTDEMKRRLDEKFLLYDEKYDILKIWKDYPECVPTTSPN